MDVVDEFDTFGPLFAGEILHVEDLLDFDFDDIEEASSPSCDPLLPAVSLSSKMSMVNGGAGDENFSSSCSVSQQGETDLGHHQPFEPEELDFLSSFVEHDPYTIDITVFGPVSSMSYGELREGNSKLSKESTGSQRLGSSGEAGHVSSALFTPLVRSVRSKRAGAAGRLWYLQVQALKRREARKRRGWWTLKDADGDEESDGSCLDVDDDSMPKKKAKKATCKRMLNTKPKDLVPRKCAHCQVQKTPQWRSGPLGPKSLCNACGVRFKSGRLLPEYRPAGSPTFRVDLHSNSHKKVLEMRRRKPEEQQETTARRSLEAVAEAAIHEQLGVQSS